MKDGLSISDKKRLASNFSWLFCLKIASYVFPLLTIPYLAKVIGAEGYGKIAFASVVTIWVMTITDWGFLYTATRDVARCKSDMEKVSRIFSNVFWSRLLIMFVCFFLLFLLSFVISALREEAWVLAFSLLAIPGHVLFPDWFFQAMEKMKYVTIFNVLVKLVFTVAVFLFIKEKEDYFLQPLFFSLGYIISGVFSQIIISRKWKVRIRRSSFSDIFSSLKGSFDVFLSEFMPNLYNSFSQFLLTKFSGYSANGVFDAGGKFFSLSNQFLNLLSQTFFPFLSRKKEAHQLYLSLTFPLSLLGAAALWLAAPLLIDWFYTDEFSEAVWILRVLAISFPFLSLTNIYGLNLLVLEGKESLYRKIIFWVSLVGFVLSFPFTYYFSAMGVALLLLLVRMLMGVGVFLAVREVS